MSSVLQQLPALIGVVVGVVATYVATVAAERGRWQRQQSVRWDERRITAYIEYAHAVKKVLAITVRLAAQRGIHPDDDEISPEYTIADLASAEGRSSSGIATAPPTSNGASAPNHPAVTRRRAGSAKEPALTRL